jgi:hypothetical protein
VSLGKIRLLDKTIFQINTQEGFTTLFFLCFINKSIKNLSIKCQELPAMMLEV